nr:MAG TPA: hypothetical protein [Caudoviricetes sp.]
MIGGLPCCSKFRLNLTYHLFFRKFPKKEKFLNHHWRSLPFSFFRFV